MNNPNKPPVVARGIFKTLSDDDLQECSTLQQTIQSAMANTLHGIRAKRQMTIMEFSEFSNLDKDLIVRYEMDGLGLLRDFSPMANALDALNCTLSITLREEN